MTKVETTLLRPGHEISRVIKGGWQLAGDHGAVDRTAAIADMEAFLDAGITTFDCADIYTGVEEMIGDFIADVRRRRGAEIANRATVHTKLVPDLGLLSTITPDQIEAIVDRSLKRLRIERLHLVQFYWWDMTQGNAVDTLGVLKRCQEKGKIGNLGTTNWDSPEIGRFVDAGFDVVSVQIQYSVLDRRPAATMAAWAAEHDMKILCYGTLAGGFLTEKWLDTPDPGFDFDNRSLIKYRLIIDEFGDWAQFQELLHTLKSVGDRHGVSLSSVATRWVLDQPQVGAAIVGARYARHLPKTLEVFQFDLDDEDMARIGAVLARAKGPNGPVYALERDRNGRHGRIMKYNLNTRPDDKVLGKPVSEAILETSGLTRDFGSFRAVDQVSLSVKRGTITGLIGPNGAGKSTLFNLLTGSLAPTSGTVKLAGKDITGLSPDRLFAAGMGRTFQIPRPFARMSVLENLMLAPLAQTGETVHGPFLSSKAVRQQELRILARAMEVLDFVTLGPLADHPAGKISGGQMKLLELARVLMGDPELILLDEPAAGVNPTLTGILIEKIEELNRQGKTFVIIEHDMDFIMSHCDPVIAMAEGRVIFEGTAAQAQANPLLLDAYLGTPADA